MESQIIFLLLLASQTVLLSWYLPRRIQERMRYVFEHYPYEQYPKLYGGNLEKTKKNYRRHVYYNNVLFTIGIGLIAIVAYMGEELTAGNIRLLPFFYGMCQAVPLIVIDALVLKHCKRLKEEYKTPQRKATLTPRTLFNYTSWSMILTVLGFHVLAMLFDMYTKGFDTSIGIELYETVIILTCCNLFFASIIRWRVYGKKLNPLLTEEDNKRDINTVVKSSLFTSVIVSIFFITMRAINVYDLEQYEGALMSIYMQCIFFFSIIHSLNQFPVETINMENYRNKQS